MLGIPVVERIDLHRQGESLRATLYAAGEQPAEPMVPIGSVGLQVSLDKAVDFLRAAGWNVRVWRRGARAWRSEPAARPLLDVADIDVRFDLPAGASQEREIDVAQDGPMYSLEAEEALICSILVSHEAYYDVAHFIAKDMFYGKPCRLIWSGFAYLHAHGIPITFSAMLQVLSQEHKLEEIGGPTYLAELITNCYTARHAEAYARIVEACAIRRARTTERRCL